MIRPATAADFHDILAIINDGASAYKGVIPGDCWHEPYMTADALKKDIAQGVEFFMYEENNLCNGVMGIQHFPDVSLIRHAYTKTAFQKKGIGAALLRSLLSCTTKPVLIGTWASTPWSIHFYTKNGFTVLPDAAAQTLLSRYWPLTSQKHRLASVVLADATFLHATKRK